LYKKPAAWLIAVALLSALAFGAWKIFSPRPEAIHSIAVLPFTSATQDAKSEDLSDGITEAIIDTVSQVPDVKVMSRGSVFRYKHKEVDPQQVGRDLKVDAVLTGSIAQRGDRLVLNTELVKVDDGSHLWGKQYDRNQADVLTVQQEVAAEVSQRLQPKLTGEQKNHLATLPTQNAESYQLYVKGRYFFDRWSSDGRKKALENFQQAIAKDPAYAAAYSGLADTLTLTGVFGDSDHPEIRAQALAAATKAIALENTLAEGHASMGLVKLIDLKWAESEAELQKAIALNPNYAPAHLYYGWYLSFTGRSTEAFQQVERAQALDPLSFTIYITSAEVYYWGRDYDRALQQQQKAAEVEPSHPSPQSDSGDIYLAKNMCAEATEHYARYEELAGQPKSAAALRQAFATSGCQGMLRKQLALSIDPASPDYDLAAAASIAAKLGEKDLAFKLLEQGYKERRSGIVYVKVEPMLDNLRSDPRYADLLKRVGLSP
jgi:TolB-like protein/Tfp pilus assembly protein PilF